MESLNKVKLFGLSALVLFAVMFSLVGSVSAAGFSGAPTMVLHTPQISGGSVTISGSSQSTAQEATTISYINWNWGDGQQSSGFFPQSHFYDSNGEFPVMVTASDNLGNTASSQILVDISNPASNSAPTIPHVSYIVSSLSDLTVAISGSVSAIASTAQNQKATIVSSKIDWNDGSSTSYNGAPPASASHQYKTYQKYTISVFVRDSLQNTYTEKIDINLVPPPGSGPAGQFLPVMSITPQYLGGLTVNLTGYAYPAPNSGASSLSSLMVYWHDDDQTVTSCLNTQMCDFTYPSQGSYTATVIAIDNKGNRNSVDVLIYVPQGPSPSVVPGTTAGGSTTTPATVPSAGSGSTTSSPSIDLSVSVRGLTVSVDGNVWATATGATLDLQQSQVTWNDPNRDGGAGSETLFQCGAAPCSYPYAGPGQFTATLVAVDTLGNKASVNIPLNIPSVTTFPVSNIAGKPSGGSSSSGVTGSSSTAPSIQLTQKVSGLTVSVNGNIYPLAVSNGQRATLDTSKTTIDWGDPSTTVPESINDCPGSAPCSHTYPNPGSYAIKITAVDSLGNSNVQQINVNVNSATSSSVSSSTGSQFSPTALPVIQVTPQVSGLKLSIYGNIYPKAANSQSDSASLDAAKTQIVWNDPANGTITSIASCPGSAPCAHTYANPGTYTVSITAVDSYGNVNTQQLIAKVSGSSTSSSNSGSTVSGNPTALPTIALTHTSNGLMVSVDGNIYATAVSGGTQATIDAQRTKIFWGDSNNNQISTLAQCSSTCAHTYSQPGSYTITVVAVDSLGNSNQQYIPVTISAPQVSTTTSTASTTTSLASNPSGTPIVSVFVSKYNGLSISLDGNIYATAINSQGVKAQLDLQRTKIFWGDPSSPSATQLSQCGATCDHTYSLPGSYTITIVAVDTFGNSYQTYLPISVSLPDGSSLT